MKQNAREEILSRLKQIPQPELPPRPEKIPQLDLPEDIDGRIETFKTELETKTGVVHRIRNSEAALEVLAGVAAVENIKTLLSSGDETLTPFNLRDWGRQFGITVLEVGGYKGKDEFRAAAFDQCQAGITGVDYAFSESATLAIRHRADNARLASLAPPIHIAIVPVERLHRYYEEVILDLYRNRDATPSQLTFITGPSTTADIAATPTVGMHGPKKLFTIFVG